MLTANRLSPELEIERWEDRRDIKNLMGRFVYDCLIKNEREIYASHWSSREDVCLMYPWGTYKGAAAVKGFYAGLDRYNRERAAWFRELFPEQTEKLDDEKMYGIGSYDGRHLTTPCIYVADDGETAQATYWIHQVDDRMSPAGSVAHWSLGLLFLDLVYENDQWKIWHMRNAYEVDGPHGQPFGASWIQPGPEIPALAAHLKEAEAWFPKPNNPTSSHEVYSTGRTAPVFPPCPHPYATWDDAQSYGI